MDTAGTSGDRRGRYIDGSGRYTLGQLAKMSFDKIFDLTAGVYFYFYNIHLVDSTEIRETDKQT